MKIGPCLFRMDDQMNNCNKCGTKFNANVCPTCKLRKYPLNNFCMDCGIKLSGYRPIRCDPCSRKIPRNRGYKPSEEHKRKISEKLKGRKTSKETRRKLSLANKGRKMSKEQRKKMSENSIKLGISKGKKNPMYGKKGKLAPSYIQGLSPRRYPFHFNKKLKEEIKKKYQYRCQQCFRHQDELKKTLNIHHIDYNPNNNNPNNLIPLCKVCHSQSNFKREDWIDYFKEKIII